MNDFCSARAEGENRKNLFVSLETMGRNLRRRVHPCFRSLLLIFMPRNFHDARNCTIVREHGHFATYVCIYMCVPFILKLNFLLNNDMTTKNFVRIIIITIS